MRNTALTIAVVGIFSMAFASSVSAQSDTVRTKKRIVIDYEGITINAKKDSTVKTQAGNARFVGGITFTRLDIGFVKLIDNGSFKLSPANDFLDYNGWKTSSLSFDVLQMGYRFNNHFKAYLAGGFDWTLIRLDRNITIQKNTPRLEDYVVENIEFSKNRFSSSYVHFPLNFEFRTRENDKGKGTDDYHFTPFRYGAAVRLGYGGLGVFAKYYANDMFETANQDGLKSMSFGLTFGLN